MNAQKLPVDFLVLGYTSIILKMGDIITMEYKLIILICNNSHVKLLFTMLTET